MKYAENYESVICSIVFLIFHSSQLLYYAKKTKYECVPYFTDLIENFEINIICRHFVLIMITFQFSILFFENEFSFTYIFGSLSCIFLTGVLVHTLSENAISRKLHFIYASFGIFFGVIFNICNIVKYDVNLINVLLFVCMILSSFMCFVIDSKNKFEINYPIAENLIICSFIPIYFDVYWEYLIKDNGHIIAILYSFVYFLAYTEIRYDPKGSDTNKKNKFDKFFYRKYRDQRLWFHNFYIVIDIFCIVFNLNQRSLSSIEIAFFNKVDVLDRNQNVRGVGGFEITIYEPDFIL